MANQQHKLSALSSTNHHINEKTDPENGSSNIQTQVTWMNREMAEKLAQKEEEQQRNKTVSGHASGTTTVDATATAADEIQTTVFEYDDDDCGEYNPDDEDTKRRIIPMHELRPMLDRLKSTAQCIRQEHADDANWDGGRIHSELLHREPEIAARIARTNNYEFMLKYIASKIYTANHDNLLGYLLYMWEMVEQGNISLPEAKAMVEPNIRKMTHDIEMREKQEQRQREKRERKLKKKNKGNLPPSSSAPNTPNQ